MRDKLKNHWGKPSQMMVWVGRYPSSEEIRSTGKGKTALDKQQMSKPCHNTTEILYDIYANSQIVQMEQEEG